MTDPRQAMVGLHAKYQQFEDRVMTPTEYDEFQAYRQSVSFIFRPPNEPASMAGPMTEAERLAAGGFRESVAGEDFARIVTACKQARQAARGMMVLGAPGSGKTLAVRALFPKAKFYTMSNPDVLRWLTTDLSVLSTGVSVVFDDMGTEHEKNEYGVRSQVVGDWIERAYAAKQSGAWLGVLHMTTNLQGKDFVDRYGARVSSRVTELVVSVRMTGGDKRQKIKIL